MRLWIARGSEVTIREQLVTQVVLGILSSDLSPGQRLPSTRELARRFRVHPNTISAGYRQLERERWVEHRHGSGVFIKKAMPKRALPSSLALDQLIAGLFQSARVLGAPLDAVQARLRQWLELQPPDHFLLIEPDENLREIVVTEMQKAVSLPVRGCALQDYSRSEAFSGAIAAALPGHSRAVRQEMPAGADLITLQVGSVPSSLAAWLPAPSGTLVGIASRWPRFLRLSRTMLAAAGFRLEGLVFRDARKPNWRRGLEQAAAVVCDSLTAKELPKGSRAIVFPLLAQASVEELQRYERFITNPMCLL